MADVGLAVEPAFHVGVPGDLDGPVAVASAGFEDGESHHEGLVLGCPAWGLDGPGDSVGVLGVVVDVGGLGDPGAEEDRGRLAEVASCPQDPEDYFGAWLREKLSDFGMLMPPSLHTFQAALTSSVMMRAPSLALSCWAWS